MCLSFSDSKVSEEKAYLAFEYNHHAPCISHSVPYQKLVSVQVSPEYCSREMFKKEENQENSRHLETFRTGKKELLVDAIEVKRHSCIFLRFIEV